MLALAGAGLRMPKGRAYRSGAVRRTSDRQQAERWVEEGLRAAGLNAEELAGLPGSDGRKVALARLLWQRTTVSQGWIAERLAMRSAANVSQQIRRQVVVPAALPRKFRRFIEEQAVNN
jgi:hypothetical protein